MKQVTFQNDLNSIESIGIGGEKQVCHLEIATSIKVDQLSQLDLTNNNEHDEVELISMKPHIKKVHLNYRRKKKTLNHEETVDDLINQELEQQEESSFADSSASSPSPSTVA